MRTKQVQSSLNSVMKLLLVDHCNQVQNDHPKPNFIRTVDSEHDNPERIQ